MNQSPLQGDLAKTPFPHILAGIWREERSGFLKIDDGTGEKAFCFENGRLAVDRKTFDERGFSKSLASLGLAGVAELERVDAVAGENGWGFVRSLSHSGLFSPRRIWELMETFIKSELYAIFNQSQGLFDFESAAVSSEDLWIRGLLLPDLILEGIRRMWNFALIEAQLPPPGESVQVLSSGGIEFHALAPHERYVLEAASSAGSLEALFKTSDLGERETKRILFALLVLGNVGTHQAKNKNGKARTDLSLAEMDRLFTAFNDRCSYIGKYISKEIGPVALNVIEKSLDEIKNSLDPIFQNCRIKPDARIELGPGNKRNLGVLSEEARKSLLQSFDEILAAEVLAVKRTLGNDHEAALVRGLEKLGGIS